MIWTLYDWLNKFYSFCIAAVVGILSRHGLSIYVHHEDHPNKHKLALYKPSIYFNSSTKLSNKTECFSYKGGSGVTRIEAFKRRASFGFM